MFPGALAPTPFSTPPLRITLPPLAANLPTDAQKAFEVCAAKIAQAMVALDRARDLPVLHSCLRGNATMDKRLVAAFADALRKLASLAN